MEKRLQDAASLLSVPGIIAGMNTANDEIKNCEYKTFTDFANGIK
jgi:hypothetical protein